MYISGFKFLALLTLANLVRTQDTNLRTVEEAFEAASIPQDIFITFKPTALLEVTFPQPTGPSITLHAGIQLPRNATAGPPTFAAAGLRDAGPFVVATVDPDAPMPADPTEAEIRHFLGANFFAIDPRAGEGGVLQRLVNETAAISNFKQPTPPAGSPAHRYIFLLFEQPEGFNAQTLVTADTSIENFNISAFAEATGLGNPVAGTFMLVAPDPTTD
ncbi:hypothetical protein H0H92_011240 [Tricholoma furcatifolium]|nr:hypothetical protein H0H92_011240 [Tricholoma furcatifolium]